MSFLERIVEEKLARAARSGELDVPHLSGKPIPDLDRPRPTGWWADQFVARERSAQRRQDVDEYRRRARTAFWRCIAETELREQVAAANAEIATRNEHLLIGDRVDAFDPDDIVDRWRRLGF